MIRAIQGMVKVKLGGRIEIPASELVQEPALTETQDLPREEAIARVQAMVRRHVPEKDIPCLRS
jgi:hypothetical protein